MSRRRAHVDDGTNAFPAQRRARVEEEEDDIADQILREVGREHNFESEDDGTDLSVEAYIMNMMDQGQVDNQRREVRVDANGNAVNGGTDNVAVADPNTRAERIIGFTGQDYSNVKRMLGMDIRPDPAEKAKLVELERKLKTPGYTGTEHKKLDTEEYTNKFVRDNYCRLCNITDPEAMESSNSSRAAYSNMARCDLANCGNMTEWHNIQLCTKTFNKKMAELMLKNHKDAFFVTADEVAVHLIQHNKNNPKRKALQGILIAEEMYTDSLRHVKGHDAQGRHYFNSAQARVSLGLLDKSSKYAEQLWKTSILVDMYTFGKKPGKVSSNMSDEKVSRHIANVAKNGDMRPREIK